MYTFILLLASIVQIGSGINCNGGTATGRLIYDATRPISRVGNELVICSYNLCKHIDIKIERVETSGAGVTCRSGGVGDYQVEINVAGGDNRSFTAKIWASGKDVGKVISPTNPYGWPCYVQSVYQDRSHC